MPIDVTDTIYIRRDSIVKRLLICVIFLVLLAGCQMDPVESVVPSTLPIPIQPMTETGQIEPVSVTEAPEEALPVLETRKFSEPTILGPAGKVNALYYRKLFDSPVYGDLDGDGRKELVYKSYGSSNGTVYDLLFCYGLEEGWPVQKGVCILDIGSGATELRQKEGQVFYSYTDKARGKEAVLLPLRLEDNRLWLPEELPEGLSWAGNSYAVYGLSIRWLREKLGDKLLYEGNGYFIWQDPAGLFDQEETEGTTLTIVVASSNGVTVTNHVRWFTEADGTHSASANACKVEQPERLIGKTEQTLIHSYGEAPLELERSEDGSCVLGWFTDQGKLLTVRIEETVVSAELTDLPIPDAP